MNVKKARAGNSQGKVKQMLYHCHIFSCETILYKYCHLDNKFLSNMSSEINKRYTIQYRKNMYTIKK